MSDKHKLFVKNVGKKKVCTFGWKCKERGEIAVQLKKVGSSPRDLVLCKGHAEELMNQLFLQLTGQSLADYANTMQESGTALTYVAEKSQRQEKLLEAVMTSKDKRITNKMLSALIEEGGMDYNGEDKLLEKAFFYINGHERVEEVAPEIECEDGEYDFEDFEAAAGTMVEFIFKGKEVVKLEDGTYAIGEDVIEPGCTIIVENGEAKITKPLVEAPEVEAPTAFNLDQMIQEAANKQSDDE